MVTHLSPLFHAKDEEQSMIIQKGLWQEAAIHDLIALLARLCTIWEREPGMNLF
jgi:hypothetical protein